MKFPEHTLEWAKRLSTGVYNSLSANQKIREALTELDNHKSGSLGKILKEFHELIFSPRTKTIPKLKSAEKKRIAEMVYYGLSYRYGFEEALRTGNWTPWPDETDSINCYGQSIANYLVAKECGLKPRVVEFIGLQEEGHTHRAGHSLIVVDVGEDEKPEIWTIDQQMAMFGPVNIGNNLMIVENIAEIQDRTHRKDFRKKTFDYLVEIVSDEERILEQMENLRSNPEAVLYSGQRIACPYVDSWQSGEPMQTGWYLKFLPDRAGLTRGRIVSRISLVRPGIKSRGLEFAITLGKDNEVKDERLIGYYCGGEVWSDFIDPIPLVDFSLDEGRNLVNGLTNISIDDRVNFELELMKKSYSGDRNNLLEAAEQSFRRASESEYQDIILGMSAAEAIYQHDKNSKADYLSTKQRAEAIKRLKSTHPLIQYYADVDRFLKKYEKLIKGRDNQSRNFTLLRPDQVEDPNTRVFLALRSEQERLDYITKHRPIYFDDAVDRLVFYDRRIKGREGKIFDIARETFGDNYDRALFSGYARIFGEFLGHFAVTFPELTLEKYKRNLLRKLTSNN